LKFLRALKVVNLSRLSKIIANSTFKDEIKALLKLLYLVVIYVLYIHLIACICFRILMMSEIWIPPLDYLDYESSTFFSGDNMVYRYMICIYYMICCIGGNELGPVAGVECGFICYCMIAGCIINSYLFG
jgi:hypothetical protein